MFLISWAKLSQKLSIKMLKPKFNRSILHARQPPYYCSVINEMYTRLSSVHLEESKKRNPLASLVSRIYYINDQDVQVLQSNASKHGK
jgi:hypothetical protein